MRIQGYPPFASEVALYLSKRARHLMTLFVVNMPPSTQRIGFGVPKASFLHANTASSAQRIGFGVSRATSSACHAASAHAPHFGTHPNANPGTHRNSNPGTHRNAGPRVLPAKQQVDESSEEPPHFGTPLNSHPGTPLNWGCGRFLGHYSQAKVRTSHPQCLLRSALSPSPRLPRGRTAGRAPTPCSSPCRRRASPPLSGIS